MQPILFAETDLPHHSVEDPEAVLARLNDMLGKMRAAANWPWKTTTVASYRETLWPLLLSKLPDAEQAKRLGAEFDVEAARLDAAA